MQLVIALSPVLADAGGSDHMSGWGWGWMMGGWLAMILVASLIVWAFRGTGSPGAPGPKIDPEGILAERFARGEISVEEYEERLAVLRR